MSEARLGIFNLKLISGDRHFFAGETIFIKYAMFIFILNPLYYIWCKVFNVLGGMNTYRAPVSNNEHNITRTTLIQVKAHPPTAFFPNRKLRKKFQK